MNNKISEGILFTDFYQITMAQVYFKEGMHKMPSRFEYFFRHYPDYGAHKAGYCVNAGLETFIKWMMSVRFDDESINCLRQHTDLSGRPVFQEAFLEWLKNEGNFNSLSIYAIPEGRVIHPNVPIVVIEGPIALAQILETSLLNHLNYQILIATKAARVKESALGRPVFEFGMRRGPGMAVNAGARATLIGGADFTSNAGISYQLGYKPKGTHAHSMVQAFLALGKSEIDAFRACAELYQDSSVLLVDTIDTLRSGVPNAIKIFTELRDKGYKPLGIRLDSGDLAYLAIQSVKMLDNAGFNDVNIVLSNQLDEIIIWQIITQIRSEAARYGVNAENLINRLIYGVGTSLITSKGHEALDGVCKLVAVFKNSEWKSTMKLAENTGKTLNPARKKIWRVYEDNGKAVGDFLSLDTEKPYDMDEIILRHPMDNTKKRILKKSDIFKIEELLTVIMDKGQLVYKFPSIEEIRKTKEIDMANLHSGVKRIIFPHEYHVSLTDALWKIKENLITKIKDEIGRQ
ncbi:nicotinate phosphoribosyltransferase [Candidatus Omnitrophus magneticus]|uniref:Nicotinate phosphoribosyltransferase n=1 Tax=Candidatus Omnitrophus magneticus TaxID=1609969 RepID=A0A0F0CTT1_9BACT|nr:nicotinate phosphoribosyltransferase [Candidatus Omnitrophus magneticus]